MRDEIVRLAKQLIDYSINPDVRREIQSKLAAALGAPVEIPKPETPGRYFVCEAGRERCDVVKVYEVFEELRVSYFMQDRATTLFEILAGLVERVQALEKAAEPKPDFVVGELEKAAKLYAKNCPNAWDMSEAETEEEFEKAFEAGARWFAESKPKQPLCSTGT